MNLKIFCEIIGELEPLYSKLQEENYELDEVVAKAQEITEYIEELLDEKELEKELEKAQEVEHQDTMRDEE